MRKANAKERLLNTAGQLFHERGFSEVGINEIIETAETAKASFYQHFKSKEALCEAWLETVHDRSEQWHRDILNDDSDPVKKVETYFDNLEKYMVANDFRGCPFANTATVTAQDCCGILGKIEEHKHFIRQFLQQLASQFVPEKNRAQEVGDRLFILYSGATVESQTLRDTWPIRVAKNAAVELAEQEQT